MGDRRRAGAGGDAGGLTTLDRLFVDFQAAVAGRYSLERELGRGGMGIVFLAREVRLDRPVAIKLLPPARARDGALRERFLREARTAAKLSHPNIIPIHAVDEVGEWVFFAMAYVEGETLAERVRRRGPLAPSEAARVLREVAWALAYAHARSVIHRDVKPDNILLETATGRALVADFGIAAVVHGAAGLDGEAVTGTPEFMSPEQALGERSDGRSDIYALGLVGYYALSGRLPFEAAKATEVLAKQITEPPPPLTTAAPGVPRRLAHAIDRCLAKDPAERPQKAEEWADRIGALLQQRREVPVALRAFVKHNSRLDGGGALLYPFALLIASGVVGSVAGAGGAYATLLGGMTVGPVGVLVNRARRLLKAGFAYEDLPFAFHAELEQGREERAVDRGHAPSLFERVLRTLGLVGIASLAALMAFGTLAPPSWARELGAFVFGALGITAAVGLGSGLGYLVLLQRRRDVDTEVYARFWTGSLGRLLFRIGRFFVGARAVPASLTHRPTELSLSLAAERLYEDLPRETRSQLRQVPDVVHCLERDAQRMRRRLDELQDALGGTGDEGTGTGAAGDDLTARRDRVLADLVAERDTVQRRLTEAVAALETIRLGLLRLHAGTGTVESVTTDLGLAGDVAKELDLLLASRTEVEGTLGRAT